MRARNRALLAVAAAGALLVLAVVGAAVRGPWVVEPRNFDFGFLTLPQQTPPPQETPAAAPTPVLPPASEGGTPLDLSWVGLVLAALAAGLIALLLWRLWLRYRRPLPEAEGARSSSLADPVDQIPDIPVLLRGVEAARLSLTQIVDPTDAVIAAWLSLEEAAASSGVTRHPAQTPTEFTVAILVTTDAAPDATQELLALYHLARFSTHPVTPADVDRASRCLGDIAASWHANAAADGTPS